MLSQFMELCIYVHMQTVCVGVGPLQPLTNYLTGTKNIADTVARVCGGGEGGDTERLCEGALTPGEDSWGERSFTVRRVELITPPQKGRLRSDTFFLITSLFLHFFCREL